MTEYRPVVGMPGYRVGDDGTVWTCKKTVYVKGHRGSQIELTDDWQLMSLDVDKSTGYQYVNLSHCGKRRRRLVHHLVLEAFVGPRPPKHEGCHFPDRNRCNNSVNNLRWDTRKNNREDMRVHGTLPNGSTFYAAKLTDVQIDELWKLRTEGFSGQRLARIFDLTPQQISRILSGKSRKTDFIKQSRRSQCPKVA